MNLLPYMAVRILVWGPFCPLFGYLTAGAGKVVNTRKMCISPNGSCMTSADSKRDSWFWFLVRWVLDIPKKTWMDISPHVPHTVTLPTRGFLIGRTDRLLEIWEFFSKQNKSGMPYFFSTHFGVNVSQWGVAGRCYILGLVGNFPGFSSSWSIYASTAPMPRKYLMFYNCDLEFLSGKRNKELKEKSAK